MQPTAKQQAQIEQAKLNLEKYKIDQDNQTKIQVATISALGYSEDKDINDNSIPDVVEMNKLALEEMNAMETNSLKREELRRKITDMLDTILKSSIDNINKAEDESAIIQMKDAFQKELDEKIIELDFSEKTLKFVP